MSEHIMSQFLKSASSASRAFSRHMKTFLFMGKIFTIEILDASRNLYAACSDLGAICSLSENAGKVEVCAL